MRIGLFFGSFNPVHVGHMVLANYMLSYTDLNEIWFVVSPHNPLKDRSTLLDQSHRLVLVNVAIDDAPGYRSCNIEFTMPQPSYTINTLARLSEKHPKYEFALLLGHDTLGTLDRWKNYEAILEHYDLYVYPRKGTESTKFDTHPRVHLTSAPQIDISSTMIRNGISEGRDMRYFLPGKVWEEIDMMNFYRKKR